MATPTRPFERNWNVRSRTCPRSPLETSGSTSTHRPPPFDTFLAIIYHAPDAGSDHRSDRNRQHAFTVSPRTNEGTRAPAGSWDVCQAAKAIDFAESLLIAVFGTGIGLALGVVFSAAVSTVIAGLNPRRVHLHSSGGLAGHHRHRSAGLGRGQR